MDMMAKVEQVGVGALDQYLEGNDLKNGRLQPWRNYQDYARIGLTALSLFGETMASGMLLKVSKDISGSFVTLLTKSVLKPVFAPKTAASASIYAQKKISSFQPLTPKPKLY